MKFSRWKFNVLLFAMLIGFAVSLQVKNVKGEYQYVPLRVIHDYKVSIESEQKEIENLHRILLDKKNQVKEYEIIKETGGDIEDAMLQELEEQKLIGGFVDVEGPGVILVLNDGTRELFEGEDPNTVLVHDMDVLNLINDLKEAGAEAISINGQRVLATSEMTCAGYTIRINNQVFAQPFIIKAIGDPKTLEAALKAPDSYAQILKEFYGLYVEVNTVLNMKIDKFSEDINHRYLTEVKEGV
ncbi:uncharacterized protein YlxW (UPF0749 family) [Anaerosolibacter carboniphilus]|uniref:Uncharacterized protein YlxW (UPF0749 family) n=1 Tax=Anaerosolibacter carboniphilus TaxID=1417629 RepID=A0A841KY98_9FIRM|nr:DUF881 domain-containing protein [Anaerosolibacter carboniphilus]MBB6218746.1 uncharacterized protein YlxW (UPF0749 family) [Anaerosolibacter carboniphilus]